MQFALLIYESPKAFGSRKKDDIDAYTGAWRSYYKALVDAGVYVGRARRRGWPLCSM
jgi:hypothetical protein